MRDAPGVDTAAAVHAGRCRCARLRAWIAAVLTAQWAIGLILMLSAFALLGWLASIMVSDVGTWFLSYARAVADLNLPGRVLALVGHCPPWVCGGYCGLQDICNERIMPLLATGAVLSSCARADNRPVINLYLQVGAASLVLRFAQPSSLSTFPMRRRH
jgi:hypothetical protein